MRKLTYLTYFISAYAYPRTLTLLVRVQRMSQNCSVQPICASKVIRMT